ncbi:MAG: S8 family serine peptidase, partial [Clostridiales Family XIII bacterium]|nr:S8 family serine peptidase [Clostridiales Family XIII bacterium]
MKRINNGVFRKAGMLFVAACLVFVFSTSPIFAEKTEYALLDSTLPDGVATVSSLGTEAVDELVENGEAKPNEVILVMKDRADEDRIVEDSDEILATGSIGERDKMVVLETETDIGAAIAEYENDPNVEYAQPNYIYALSEEFDAENIDATAISPLANPNDSSFASQWNLSRGFAAKINEAWDVMPKSSAKVRVAVVDSGVDINHPDLKNSINSQLAYNVADKNRNVTDNAGHGTHVAGIIAAQTGNGLGVAGVSFNKAEIVPLKVFYKDPDTGKHISDTGLLVEAYSRIKSANCKVVNLSLGGSEPDPALEKAINAAAANGVITVAAAGNDARLYSGATPPCYPSDYENVISVVATDRNNVKADYSEHNRYKDIAAPGSSIYSTALNGAYGYMSGTSMACPHISGVVALMLSINPSLSNDRICRILYNTSTDLGDKGRDDKYGYGLVNAEAAVKDSLALKNGTLASVAAKLNTNETSIAIEAKIKPYLIDVSKVQFAVWGNAGGQNDLKWYTATKKGAGVYQVAVPVANHKEAGGYSIHVYATLTNGSRILVGSSPEAAVNPPTGKVSVSSVNAVSGTFKVRLSGISSKSGINGVEIPVWSESNQSDIHWYKAVKQS